GVAADVDELRSVRHEFADKGLLGAEIIAERAVVLLAGGLHDLAHRHAVHAALGKEPPRRQLDLLARRNGPALVCRCIAHVDRLALSGLLCKLDKTLGLGETGKDRRGRSGEGEAWRKFRSTSTRSRAGWMERGSAPVRWKTRRCSAAARRTSCCASSV